VRGINQAFFADSQRKPEIGDPLDRIKIFILPYGPLFFRWKTPILNGSGQRKSVVQIAQEEGVAGSYGCTDHP